MKKMNLVFGSDYSDVDILAIPDAMQEQIETMIQDFFDWLPEHLSEHTFWTKTEKGNVVYSIGTDEILWWLNRNISTEEEKVRVICSHCKADSSAYSVEV